MPHHRPAIPRFAAPVAGVDRSTITVSSGGNGWWQELFNRSNFGFIGVYLTAGPDAPHTKVEYSVASGNVGKGWTREFQNIQNQGWGFAFFYTGYSSGLEMVSEGWGADEHKFVLPPPGIDANLAGIRGTLHAQHIKSIVASFGPQSAGSVVYVDNEDHVPRPAWLWVYYDSMFEEMRLTRPGGPPAVRPGLYAASVAAAQAMPNNPDLFVWLVSAVVPSRPLWMQHTNTILFDLTPFPMRGFRHNRDRDVMIAVGRQGRLNYNQNLPSPSIPQLPGQKPWDFDMCFVRDPRFPIANPRIRKLGTHLVRGSYDKANRAMVIREVNDRHPEDLTSSIAVEPEAPIFLTLQPELFTINIDGQIVYSTKSVTGQWSTLLPLPGVSNTYPLRRLRAFNLTARGSSDLQLFYLSSTNQIIGRRRAELRQGLSPWTEPTIMCDRLFIHSFSALAISTDESTVNVFAIDQDGMLQVASWVSTPQNPAPSWPGNISRALQDMPTLLVGTALRTAIPSSRQQVLFAVARDLRLNAVIFTQGQGWSPLIALGDPERDKLFAHSRLATYSAGANIVRVAAIAQNGDPSVFTVTLSGNTAVAVRSVFSHHAQRLPRGQEVLLTTAGAAAGIYYDINPFGDLSLGMEGTDLTLTCVGTRPGTSAMLRKKVDASTNWTLFVEQPTEP